MAENLRPMDRQTKLYLSKEAVEIIRAHAQQNDTSMSRTVDNLAFDVLKDELGVEK